MALLGKVPYKNHGRRHAAGGSDPIPGLGGGDPDIGLTTLITSTSALVIPPTTVTDVDYGTFAINNLGVTTGDDINFSVPGIGANPLFFFSSSIRIESVADIDPSDWLFTAPGIPEVTAFLSGTMPINDFYYIQKHGPYYGTTGSNTFSTTIWHNNAVDVEAGNRRISITYIGQWG